jgi:tRNA threonylcarbamoyladenosine biosynthesis protein TsaB
MFLQPKIIGVEPLLAIETTGRILSVAVDFGGGAVERRSSGALSHLTDLVPTVSALLAAEGAELASLAAIAVSAGPGSFTGIRIGVSAARAMAQVAELPVIKVPTLETFVYGYEAGEIVCPMLDARRGQRYCGAYRLTGEQEEIETLVPGAARDEDEFDAALDKALRARGLADSPRIRRVRDEDEPQSAGKVLKWARAFGKPTDYTKLEPVYMRKAEAQRRLEERLAAGAP